jgi:putative ABC transport system substrate-binding protein
MRLITLAVILVASLALAPLAAMAQQPGKAPRIGMLSSGTLVDPDSRVAALRQALRGRGYVDGQNIAIEPRGSDDIPRLYDLATDLVKSKVDVIVTQGTPGVQAALRRQADCQRSMDYERRRPEVS